MYVPNTKFSVADKEFEFDKEIVPLLKDKTLEDKFRDLYTKAYGIDFVKERLNNTKSEAQKFRKELESVAPIKTVYNDVQTFIKNKDYDSLFDTLKLKDEDIFRYVHNKLQLQEMSPLQQAEYARQRELQKRAYDLEKQNQYLQDTYTNEVVQARQLQLDSELGKPEVRDFITQFDTRLGQPGAFKNEVISRGVLHYQQTGEDLPVEQVVKQVLAIAGYQANGQIQAQANMQATSTQNAQASAGKSTPVVKPTLPNLSGKGTSPVKSGPKNLDDLRKLAANF